MPAKEFSIEQRGVGMLKLAEEIIDDAERAAQRGASLEGALAVLRGLDIDNFGLLLLGMPDPRWPALSVLLPAASTEEMDRHLTGDTGVSLLLKSTRFMRALEADFLRYTGRSLLGVRVLDYGYGYGRLTRLMLKYTDPVSIYGCDVAQRSLDWASQLRLPGQYALIDEAPTSLPFAPGSFDLIYAVSAFYAFVRTRYPGRDECPYQCSQAQWTIGRNDPRRHVLADFRQGHARASRSSYCRPSGDRVCVFPIPALST